ncbi:MAG: DUF817 domain-containing protein [Trueperaceae bacterium]
MQLALRFQEKLRQSIRGGWLLELLAFTYKNAASCVFPIFIFLLLAVGKVLDLSIPRYDFLLLGCLAMQALMLATKLETLDELKVICVFHVLGLTMELFKTQMGSWVYPETAFTKLYTVPLYSGFMYASIASFMCQSWRRFGLRLEHWPPAYLVVPIGAIIYLNFFSHHYIFDLRYILIVSIFVLFFRAKIFFTTYRRERAMPLVLAFVLIGIFVWFAENIGTFLGAWVYPNQINGWQVVEPSKIIAWGLLVIVSFLIVAQLKHVKEGKQFAKSSD